jgi:hypothetical protein
MLGSAEIVVIGISAFGVIGCVVATLLAFRSYGKQAKPSQGTKGSAVQEPLFNPKAYISRSFMEPTNYPPHAVIWSRLPRGSATRDDIQTLHEDLVQAYDLLNDAGDRLAYIEPEAQALLTKGAARSHPSVVTRMGYEEAERSTLNKGLWQKTLAALQYFVPAHERSSDPGSPETKRKPPKHQG